MSTWANLVFGVVNSILFVLHLISVLNVATLNEQYFYVVIVTLFLRYLIFSCRMIVLPSSSHINSRHSQCASFTYMQQNRALRIHTPTHRSMSITSWWWAVCLWATNSARRTEFSFTLCFHYLFEALGSLCPVGAKWGNGRCHIVCFCLHVCIFLCYIGLASTFGW